MIDKGYHKNVLMDIELIALEYVNKISANMSEVMSCIRTKVR